MKINFVCNECGCTDFYTNYPEEVRPYDTEHFATMQCENCDSFFAFQFKMVGAFDADNHDIHLLDDKEIAMNKAIAEGDLDAAWPLLFHLPPWRQESERWTPHGEGFSSVHEHMDGYYLDLRGELIDISEWEHDWLRWKWDDGKMVFLGVDPDASDSFKAMLWHFVKNRITSFVNDW